MHLSSVAVVISTAEIRCWTTNQNPHRRYLWHDCCEPFSSSSNAASSHWKVSEVVGTWLGCRGCQHMYDWRPWVRPRTHYIELYPIWLWEHFRIPQEALEDMEMDTHTPNTTLPNWISGSKWMDSWPAPINLMLRLCISTPLYPPLTPTSPPCVHGLKSA